MPDRHAQLVELISELSLYLRIEREHILRWLADRQIRESQINLLPDTGFVNRVYQIGDELILRITKESGDGGRDARTESVAVPVVVSVGVLTPELLIFDDSRKIFPTTATLYKRAPGFTLGRLHVNQGELPSLYREIGVQIGILHRNVTECPDPNGFLDDPTIFPAREQLNKARVHRKVEAVSYDWLSSWLDILEPSLEGVQATRFLHNDLHSFNTMVHQGPLRLSGLIDWGDAGWGDPVLEFETMPVWAVDWLLEGYEEVLGPVDDTFRGRLLWHNIGAALDASIDEWVETDEPWQPLTTSRWINMIRHFSQTRDAKWTKWEPDF